MRERYRPPRPGHYRIGRGVQRRGATLICAYPLRILRPGATALALIAHCANEHTCAEVAALCNLPIKRVEALCEQLYWKGLLDAGPRVAPETWPGISIIIPTHNRVLQLERCLTALLELRYPSHCLEIIVVDDASSDGTATMLAKLAREYATRGITLRNVRHAQRQGVAISRNSGAEQARLPLLAFIDSDCVATPDWLAELVPLFQDTSIGAVGGMIRAFERRSTFGRYEDVHSSLFMGKRPQQVKAEGPLTYLPTANFLLRRDEWQKLGGFAPLSYGEDVDFCRRLLASGSAIRYEPRGIVLHDYRTDLKGFLKTRVSYASSEAVLLQRHATERRALLLPPEQATFAGLVIGGIWNVARSMRQAQGGASAPTPHPSPLPPLLTIPRHHRDCHPERSEGSRFPARQTLRFAQGDKSSLLAVGNIHQVPQEPSRRGGSGGVVRRGRLRRPRSPKSAAERGLSPRHIKGGGRPQGSKSPAPHVRTTPAPTMIMFILAALLMFCSTRRRLAAVRRQGISLNPFVVLRATLRGHLAYVYHLCRHLTRYYTLPVLLVGLLMPPLLLLALVLCAIVIGVDSVRLRPHMTFSRFALCSLLDDCAYEIGVVIGCAKQRTWKPLVPVIKKGPKASTAKHSP